jgi:uncharacterized protein YejL (UPF0352 family)
MSNLRTQLQELARSFADQVIGAIRGTSLQELLSPDGQEAGQDVTSRRRARADSPRAFASARAAKSAVAQATAAPAPRPPRPPQATGRLPRRSAEEIEATLEKIVALLKKHKEGLRAEEIRKSLAMQAKEMPRILKEGLSTKKLTSKGQKRATTYFAK